LHWPPSAPVVAVVAVVTAAAVYDLKYRRIPNALTLGAAAVAIAIHGVVNGWSGVLLAASGLGLGVGLYFPLFALGGMGAGDVKLLGAIGAWLGPMGAVWTGLFGAIAGGIMALVVALARGYAGTAMRNVGAMLGLWSVVGVQPVEGLTLANTASVRLPHALPLAAGALAALWMQ
jgi:prepilin peptidase CpaA